MAPDSSPKYQTWMNTQALEDAMSEEHAPLWAHLIESCAFSDLRDSKVMDFGCNQGGFLRLLCTSHPFEQGVGIDRAEGSIEHARAAKRALPLEFIVADHIPSNIGNFNLSFSQEVLYLLPDLDSHAREMFKALRPGGIYRAVLGCHTDNPLWPKWRELITGFSNTPPFDYSPGRVMQALEQAGFKVEKRSFGMQREPDAFWDKDWYPTPEDYRRYYLKDKLIFEARR